MLTKVGSGLSGLDADGWRRMLTSREFGTSSTDLRKTFAQLIKRLCIEELERTASLETFTAYRLIPLHKKPGLRPIGVGEVLRRIAGKVIMMIRYSRKTLEMQWDLCNLVEVRKQENKQPYTQSEMFLQMKIQKLPS